MSSCFEQQPEFRLCSQAKKHTLRHSIMKLFLAPTTCILKYNDKIKASSSCFDTASPQTNTNFRISVTCET